MRPCSFINTYCAPALVRQGLDGYVEENLRQGSRLRQEGRMAAFQGVRDRRAADRAVDRCDHVVLTGQRNRTILRGANVMALHGAESARRDFGWGQGAAVRLVA